MYVVYKVEYGGPALSSIFKKVRSINYLNRNDLVGDNLEAVCIEVFKPSSASFIVGTIYRPPSAFVDCFSNIKQMVKLIDDENKEFYLLGDLNANMLDNSNNAPKHVNAIMNCIN